MFGNRQTHLLFLVFACICVQVRSKVLNAADFGPLQEFAAQNNLELSVKIWTASYDEDGLQKQYNALSLQAENDKKNESALRMNLEKYGAEDYKNLFVKAYELNLDLVFSQERYSTEGAIIRKEIVTRETGIEFENGKSHIRISDRQGSLDEEYKEFLELMKQYELDITVENTLYNDKGEIDLHLVNTITPTAVYIKNLDNMEVTIAMEAAETLKQVSNLKTEVLDRAKLFRTYFTKAYTDYNWDVIIGGQVDVDKAAHITMVMDGETYHVLGYENE